MNRSITMNIAVGALGAWLASGCGGAPAGEVRGPPGGGSDPTGSTSGSTPTPSSTDPTDPGSTTGTTGTTGTGTTGTTGTGTTGTTGTTSTTVPPTPDACESVAAVCPGSPPSSSGQGLVPLDRCAFALDRGPAFDDLGPLVDDLALLAAPATLADVAADLNRDPTVETDVPGNPPGLEVAFRWEDSENDKTTWVPQGITGSADADASGLVDGRRWVLASWYYDEDAADAADPKGVRVAFVDVTDPADPRYRFVLLVEPLAGPSWGPVRIHAGGIAWVGDFLYVADTFNGLRVFDITRMFHADTSEDVIGCDGTVCKAGLYAYALPQIGAYDLVAPCAPAERFSFVAVDRSSDPVQLVSGEYCSTTSCDDPLSGRLVRYPLDPVTSELAVSGTLPGRTWSTDAYYAGETQLQGGVSVDGTFLLSSSEPAGGAGALYAVTESGRTSYGWIDSPEDVLVDLVNDQLWSLSEGLSDRYVFGADLSAYR
ncbi:MAG: hypothetical protein ABMB14_01590 [Myxococcota bacterium]